MEKCELLNDPTNEAGLDCFDVESETPCKQCARVIHRQKIYKIDFEGPWAKIISLEEGGDEVVAIFTDKHPERDVAVMQEIGRLRKAQENE